MEEQEKSNNDIYFFENEKKDFIVIRNLDGNVFLKIENKELEDENKKKKVLVFDLWNIYNNFLDIVDKKDNKDNKNNKDNKDNKNNEDYILDDPLGNIINKYKENSITSIVLKHCLLTRNVKVNLTGKVLKLDSLYITDELYSMSPNLGIIFQNINAKKLFLKKIKINSKKQLSNFFDFIQNIKCEELTLDDIFIELLIKENENDENELKEYFTFEKGEIIIIIMNEDSKVDKVKTVIKNLKLIDCPLFALPEENDLFKKIKEYKKISIDIDENSLLNPGIITKFKIEEGLIDVCYDLDSYQYNKENEEEKEDKEDYLEYFNYIFQIIIDNNNNYRKIKFKNFDKNKLEYITGDNYNYKNIDENEWVLNSEEKKRKKKFEEFYRKIKEDIKNKELENIKELIFDNCSTFFIELILEMIKSDLDLLKLKKCAKNLFNINRTKSLKINNLYLFDTPITFGDLDEEDKTVESSILTLKIVSLEHLCQENNINSFVALERLKILIDTTKRKIICFEMNALPLLMTYLISEQINKDKNEIERAFPEKIEGSDDFRLNWTNNSFEFQSLQNKKIILRKNNIRNEFENFHYLKKQVENFVNEDKNKNDKSDFGRDFANLDVDYNQFFKKYNINNIEIENCLFSDFKILELKAEASLQKLDKKINPTFKNFFDEKKKYKIDMKTIKEILFTNKSIDDFGHLIKLCDILNQNQENLAKNLENSKIVEKFHSNLKKFFLNINGKIAIIINDIIEQKELYCFLLLYFLILAPKTITIDKEKKDIFIPLESSYREIKKYFVKEINEEKNNKFSYTIFDYYYTSDGERKCFDRLKNYKVTENTKKVEENKEDSIKKIENIHDFKFEIKYKFNDPLDIIFK